MKMNSPFGEVFLFLTDLAWKSRITIPLLITSVFLIMDVRLQIEINIQIGQDHEDFEDSDSEDADNVEEIDDDITESSDDEYSEHDDEDNMEFINNASHIRLSLGLI